MLQGSAIFSGHIIAISAHSLIEIFHYFDISIIAPLIRTYAVKGMSELVDASLLESAEGVSTIQYDISIIIVQFMVQDAKTIQYREL